MNLKKSGKKETGEKLFERRNRRYVGRGCIND